MSLGSVLKTVFSKGLRGGWTGAAYPAVAACPQYLCVGPLFHIYASFAGSGVASVLTGVTETAILYGAETRAGQLAINAMKPGRIPASRIQSAFIPWGPGVVLNASRNILQMCGMRIVNEPVCKSIEEVAGKGPVVRVCADLASNCLTAAATMPMHMMYQFVITSGPKLWNAPQAEQNKAMVKFLRDSYFPKGKMSGAIIRDLALRAGYVATAFTMYMQIERAAVLYWPK